MTEQVANLHSFISGFEGQNAGNCNKSGTVKGWGRS